MDTSTIMAYPGKINPVNGEIMVKVGKRWRPGVQTECWWCRNSFFRPTHLPDDQPDNAVGHFCSYMCRTASLARYNPRKYTTKNCVICGDEFKVWPPSHAHRYKSCRKPECKTELFSRVTKQRHIDRGQRVFV